MDIVFLLVPLSFAVSWKAHLNYQQIAKLPRVPGPCPPLESVSEGPVLSLPAHNVAK